MGVYWTDERGVTDWRCLLCGETESMGGCECTEEEYERAITEQAARGRRLIAGLGDISQGGTSA